MPSPRAQIKNRRGHWTEEDRADLRKGYGYFSTWDNSHLSDGKLSPQGEAMRRQCWHDLREELLAEWIAAMPFSRPSAWWQYESPERRRCVSGTHPHDEPEAIADCEHYEKLHPGHTDYRRKMWYGVPCIYGNRFDGAAKYETQKEFLARHNLLTSYERDLLAKGEACPA